jgi:putative endonuclease
MPGQSFGPAFSFWICAFRISGREWVAMKMLTQIWYACLEHAMGCLNWLVRRRSSAAYLPAHLAIGIRGEDAAYFYLRRNGYTVAARRWSSGHQPGDIDLIAWQGPLLCFVEVKTRTAHDATPAEVAVDAHKRKILRSLAHEYVRQLPQETAPQVRFDVLSVYLVPGKKREFVHYENAFGWSERRPD